jgi:hypothetical protein
LGLLVAAFAAAGSYASPSDFSDGFVATIAAERAFTRLTRGRFGRLSYRSIRSRPNCGKTLPSANHVMAEIWPPSRVNTNSENPRATTVPGAER